MKTINIFVVLLCLSFGISTFAQEDRGISIVNSTEKTITYSFKVIGLDSQNDVSIIQENFAVKEGIISCNADFVTKTVVVVTEKNLEPSILKDIVEFTGYNIDTPAKKPNEIKSELQKG